MADVLHLFAASEVPDGGARKVSRRGQFGSGGERRHVPGEAPFDLGNLSALLIAGGEVPDADAVILAGAVRLEREEPLTVRREHERRDATSVPEPRGADAGDRPGRQRVAGEIEARPGDDAPRDGQWWIGRTDSAGGRLVAQNATPPAATATGMASAATANRRLLTSRPLTPRPTRSATGAPVTARSTAAVSAGGKA